MKIDAVVELEDRDGRRALPVPGARRVPFAAIDRLRRLAGHERGRRRRCGSPCRAAGHGPSPRGSRRNAARRRSRNGCWSTSPMAPDSMKRRMRRTPAMIAAVLDDGMDAAAPRAPRRRWLAASARLAAIGFSVRTWQPWRMPASATSRPRRGHHHVEDDVGLRPLEHVVEHRVADRSARRGRTRRRAPAPARCRCRPGRRSTDRRSGAPLPARRDS